MYGVTELKNHINLNLKIKCAHICIVVVMHITVECKFIVMYYNHNIKIIKIGILKS